VQIKGLRVLGLSVRVEAEAVSPGALASKADSQARAQMRGSGDRES
jgi:hypothetical protein